MASERSLKKPKQGRLAREIFRVLRHPDDCKCKDERCIRVRNCRAKMLPALQKIVEGVRRSEQITAADLAVVINVKG